MLSVQIALCLAILLATSEPHLRAQPGPPPEVDKHLQQAQVYLEREKFTDAARELRAAIALHPQIRGAYYQLGFAQFQTRQYAEAEMAFAKELGFQPPDPYSLYYLGRIRLDGGQRLQAIAYFDRSLQAGEVLDVRQRLASSYLALGRLDQAIQFLEVSIANRPDDAGLHYLLGRAYKQKGKETAAQAEFATARRWKAKARLEMESLLRLRQALAANSQNDAMQLTRELRESGDSEVLLAAAIALGGAGLHQEALPFLEKSNGLQPNLAEVHYNLGRAYLALHDKAKAQPELQRAVELKPGFYEAETLLGALLVEAGDSAQAIKHMRAAANIRSDSARLLMMLGLQYFEQRYYVDAIDVLKKAVQLEPRNPEPRFLLIQSHYRNLEYEPALKLAQDTLAQFPDNALAAFHVAAQLNNFGKFADARPYLESALAKDPKLIEARVMLGDVLFKMGKPAEGLEQFQQALAADGNLMEAHDGIGKALIQLKEYAGAAAAMERAIQIDGNLAPLHLHLSHAYRGLGRIEDAKKEAETFTRLNADRARARDQDVERKYGESQR